jgi:type IX secretion system substrate protein
MKKTLFASVLFFLIFHGSLFAQKTIEGHWGKKYLDVAYAAAAADDGGYIITGLTLSAGDTNGDIVVIKTSDIGDTQWSFTYGGPHIEGGNSVIQTADGGFMVAGHTEDFGAQDCDAFMMKLDRNGNRQWFKVFGSYADEISEGIIEVPGGGYVFAGITASWGNVQGDSESRHVYFVRTDASGDTLWTRYYAGNKAEYGYSIANMANGGFLANGWSLSFGNGEYDGWLFRLKDNGDTLWTRLYKNGGGTMFYKIIPTLDNGFVMCGYTTQTGTCKPQGFLVKLDADGNDRWKRTYGDTTQGTTFHDVVQLPNGNFMMTGTSNQADPAGNVYIMTTDADGNKISDNVYGGSNSYANAIAAQGNNSYMVAGATSKYGDSYGDLYYLEVDNTISEVPTVKKVTPSLFPNPVNNRSAIVLPSSESSQSVRMDIMNIFGQVVFTDEHIPAKNIVIDRAFLSSGTYVFRITCKDGTVFKGKFTAE